MGFFLKPRRCECADGCLGPIISTVNRISKFAHNISWMCEISELSLVILNDE